MKKPGALAIVMTAVLAAASSAALGQGSQTAGQSPPPAAGRGSSQPAEPPPGGTNAPETANAKIQFVIGEANVVRVPSQTTMITATNIAGLEKLTAADLAKQAESIALTDRGVVGGSGAGTFELGKPDFVGRSSANGLTWRVPLKADVPLSTSHTRVLTVVFGIPPDAQTFGLEYSVSAKPATAAQWTPRGATDVWTVSWSDPQTTRVYGVTIENPDEQL